MADASTSEEEMMRKKRRSLCLSYHYVVIHYIVNC